MNTLSTAQAKPETSNNQVDADLLRNTMYLLELNKWNGSSDIWQDFEDDGLSNETLLYNGVQFDVKTLHAGVTSYAISEPPAFNAISGSFPCEWAVMNGLSKEDFSHTLYINGGVDLEGSENHITMLYFHGYQTLVMVDVLIPPANTEYDISYDFTFLPISDADPKLLTFITGIIEDKNNPLSVSLTLPNLPVSGDDLPKLAFVIK